MFLLHFLFSFLALVGISAPKKKEKLAPAPPNPLQTPHSALRPPTLPLLGEHPPLGIFSKKPTPLFLAPRTPLPLPPAEKKTYIYTYIVDIYIYIYVRNVHQVAFLWPPHTSSNILPSSRKKSRVSLRCPAHGALL